MKTRKIAQTESQLIPIDQLHECPYNPNEQDAVTFANLTEEINNDGFDEPLVVVPRKVVEGPGADGYSVISGNHRLKACRELGYEAVQCSVKNWDRETCKIKIVRRNVMKGEQDPHKFTELVDSLNNAYTSDQLSDMMGFKDIDEFAKYYLEEQERRGGGMNVKATSAEDLMDGLTMIVNQLFAEYGDTIPYGFIYFMYGGKPHLMVQCDDLLVKTVKVITDICKERKKDIAEFLEEMLGDVKNGQV